jgi:hypothetical protein
MRLARAAAVRLISRIQRAIARFLQQKIPHRRQLCAAERSGVDPAGLRLMAAER